MQLLFFDFLSSVPFAADKQRHAWPRPLHNHIARTSLRPGGNKNGLSVVFISLITRMRYKRDIKMGRLYTPGGAVIGIVGGGVTFRFF